MFIQTTRAELTRTVKAELERQGLTIQALPGGAIVCTGVPTPQSGRSVIFDVGGIVGALQRLALSEAAQ